MKDVIKIKNKDYIIKNGTRAQFLWEGITQKNFLEDFKSTNLLDTHILLYCIIISNKENEPLDWDDFIDALDEDPTIYNRINEIVSKQQKKNELLTNKSEEDNSVKKKSKYN